jgi:hypothetical protein
MRQAFVHFRGDFKYLSGGGIAKGSVSQAISTLLLRERFHVASLGWQRPLPVEQMAMRVKMAYEYSSRKRDNHPRIVVYDPEIVVSENSGRLSGLEECRALAQEFADFAGKASTEVYFISKNRLGSAEALQGIESRIHAAGEIRMQHFSDRYFQIHTLQNPVQEQLGPGFGEDHVLALNAELVRAFRAKLSELIDYIMVA